MRLGLVLLLVFFSSCTRFHTARLTDQKVIVSKETTILAFWGSVVYTCDTDEKGVLTTCVENVVETKEDKAKRLKKASKLIRR